MMNERERIELLMKCYELTSSQFADRTGIQRASVSHIISGRNKPSLEVMQKIYEAFPELDPNTKEAIPTYHKGLEVTKETAVPGFKYQHKNGGNWIDFDELGEGDYYMDDSGTLYSNCLYLVKIVIKYCNKNVLDEYIDLTSEEEAIVDYRWYWTNNMFNEYYYQEKDFANL